MNRRITWALGGGALVVCAAGCFPEFAGDAAGGDGSTPDALVQTEGSTPQDGWTSGDEPYDAAQDVTSPDVASADGGPADAMAGPPCATDAGVAMAGAIRCSGLRQETCAGGAWSGPAPCGGAQACVGGNSCTLQLSIAGGPIEATQGLPLSGVVAMVTNSVSTISLSTLISWGDGYQTAGSLAGAAGVYPITGSHTYSASGSKTVTVTVSDSASGASASAMLQTTVDPTPRFTEFDVTGGQPNAIIMGPDGNPWFTDLGNDAVGTGTTSIKNYAIPTSASFPGGLALAPNNVVYFAEVLGNKIGYVSAGSTVNEIPVKTASSLPSFIAMASNPALPWFTEHNSAAGKIGRVNGDLSITEFAAPAGVVPFGICAGPDGNMWFTDTNGGVGFVTPSGTFKTFPVPDPNARPYAITASPADGNLWFTEQSVNKIGRITRDGTLTEFDVPTAGSSPASITAYGGALWFTENSGNQIGRITTTGAFTEFSVPTASSGPAGITVINASIWFAEIQAARIGQLIP